MHEWARQQSPGGYDRFDAEAAMQTSVVETGRDAGVGYDAAAQAAASEVAQAVSVAAAYFEDTLQALAGESAGGGNAGCGRRGCDDGSEWAGGLAGAGDGGRGDAGGRAVTASVPRGWLAGVRGALKS